MTSKKKKPALAARWREKYLEGRTIKIAYIKCSGHNVSVEGRHRRRVHIDEFVVKFTDGSSLSMTAELPVWGFTGPKNNPSGAVTR